MSGRIPFVHLHVLSAYSFPDGAGRLENLVRRAVEIGQPACAITDERTLHAVIPFYHEARRAGLKPILGCRLPVQDPRDPDLDGALVLLAENYLGYRHLLHLSTTAHLRPPRPPAIAIAPDDLAERRAGLIALSGGEHGAITRAIRAGQRPVAERVAAHLAALLGRDGFFIELQDQDLPGQRAVNEQLRVLAKHLGIETVATHETRYVHPQDADLQRALRHLRLGLADAAAAARPMAKGSGQFHMADAAEMAQRFADDESSLRRAGEIAARCVVDFPLRRELHFPRYPLPPEYVRADEDRSDSEFRLLRDLALAGLSRRFGGSNESACRAARDRLTYELDVIRRTGFVNYFLVVADAVRFARSRGILVGPGRGSGAGSLTAYALDITDIDPLRYALSFERFLNPERVSPPDFDIDFCPRRRAEVIAHVRDCYGEDRAAQVITFHTYAPRAAIRDAARVLEAPAADAERWARLVSDDPRATPDLRRGLAAAARRAAEETPTAGRVFELARALVGLPRNTGIHASAVALSGIPLVELTPLQRDRDGTIVTQFDKTSLASVGLLKMDFLALRTLDVLNDACESAAASGGTRPDLDTLPLDDPATIELLNRADTIGVFQLESAGMRDVLRRLGVSEFSDLLAAIALYRPAAAAILDDFIARKHGRAPIVVDHPALRPVLAETRGLLLYQEQVQGAAEALAGFTPAQGDRLRRAFAAADEGEIFALAAVFVEGGRRKHHLTTAEATSLFDRLRRFAGYGFNKAHSVAYALLAYRAAWLKAHYPAEFFCARLASEDGDAGRRAEWIAEAQRIGIEMLGPDLNRSGAPYHLEGGRIRCGLAGIKYVGPEAARAIVAEREAHGPFRGLADLCARVPPDRLPRRAVESLVLAGALDFTGLNRRRLFEGIGAAMSYGARRRAETPPAQALLPGLDATTAPDDDRLLPPAAPWPESERMRAERELIGFHLSGHPLTKHEWMFPLLGFDRLPEAAAVGRRVRCAGVAADVGGPRPFSLQTAEGTIEVQPSESADAGAGGALREGAAIWVEGRVTRTAAGRPALRAEHVGLLEDAPAVLARTIVLRLPAAQEDPEKVHRLRAVLRKHAGPVPVEFLMPLSSGERVKMHAGAAYAVTPSKTFVREVESLLGPQAVGVEVSPCPTQLRGSARPS